jgi:lysophospholipase L1-like esterase
MHWPSTSSRKGSSASGPSPIASSAIPTGPPRRSTQYRGPLVAVPKPPGTFRILLLGGSTTHGWKVNDDETIDAYLREILPRLYPGPRYEVVNLAFDGYDSNELVERLRHDGLPLAPDLVVVNAGVNDVSNARIPDLRDRDPRTLLYAGILAQLRAIERRGRPTIWTRLKHWSFALRLPGLIRSNLKARQAAATAAVRPNSQAAEFFERNLRRIADQLEARRVPILFSSEPSALTASSQAPDAASRSYWVVDAATTQQYRDTLARRMERLAGQLAKCGRRVGYLHATLPPPLFLDDCHLTPQGNRRMAETLAVALGPLMPAMRSPAAEHRVARSAPGRP